MDEINRIGLLNAFQSLDAARTKIRFCECFDEHSDIWNFSQHSHPYLELIYFLEGNAHIVVEQSVARPVIYDMVGYFPNSLHQETLDRTRTQKIFCFWLEVPGLVAPGVGVFQCSDRTGAMRWLCEQIHAEYHRKRPLRDALIRLYLDALYKHLIRAFTVNDASNIPQGFDTLLDYLERNIGLKISASQMASLIKVSESYLFRLFQQRLNTTPSEYVNQLRVNASKNLLSASAASIQAIAEQVGIESLQYFSRLFKKHTGMTPSQYRKQMRADLKEEDVDL